VTPFTNTVSRTAASAAIAANAITYVTLPSFGSNDQCGLIKAHWAATTSQTAVIEASLDGVTWFNLKAGTAGNAGLIECFALYPYNRLKLTNGAGAGTLYAAAIGLLVR